MSSSYNPSNWYWCVADSATQVYSSASGSYISLTDETYSAWVAKGNRATNISANDMILLQIGFLEQSITSRMLQEAASGSTLTGLGPNKTLTSAGYIASVRSQIETLRGQLS